MKILFTSAIIPSNYDTRKLEYIESISSLKKYIDINDIYNIECFLQNSSYLEEYLFNTFYSNTHIDTLKNKGVKEALALKSFIDNHKFERNEIVIKHTGRYRFLSRYFINQIEMNKTTDVFVRINDTYPQYFTGTFAMRFEIFKEFILQLDLNNMEKYMINIEKELYDYLGKSNYSIIEFSNIDVYSKINNTDIVIW
jgi:hypothetical protein